MVRAIGSVMVALWHLEWVANDIPSLRHIILPQWAKFGYAGVDLFFVLSGVVMADSLARRPSQTARGFAVQRLRRLCPAYWTATVVEIGLLMLAGLTAGLTRPLMVGSFLMMPLRVHPVLGVGWTLEHEVLFYFAIFGLLLLKAPTFLAPIMTLLAVITIMFHLISGGDTWDYQLLSGYNLQFAGGVGLQRLLSRNHGSSWLFWFGVLGFPLTASLIPMLYANGIAPTQPIGAVGLLRVVLFGLASVGLVGGLVALERDGKLCGRFSHVLTILGDLSFAMYLVHPLVYQAFGRVVRHTCTGDTPFLLGLALVVLAFAVVLPCSMVFHYAIEWPLLGRRVNAGSTVSSA